MMQARVRIESEGSSPCHFSFQREKKIYDAVHGFIRLNPLECALIHSEPFQRLHAVHQLGIAYFVYPGATHTRFEHSLGTMELATRILERMLSKGFVIEEASYWCQILRFAALCHDLGHLPFSHDAEEVILGHAGHEQWTVRVIQSEALQPLFEIVSTSFPGKDVVSDVLKMAVGEKKLQEMGMPLIFSSLERLLSQVICGDFFGADRIDYLLRDAQCTGVSYGLFDYHQLIEMLCVLPSGILGIEEEGIESCEALLLARHFMHQRVYQYSSVKAHKFHVSRFMKIFYETGEYLKNLDSYLSLSDNEILTALKQAMKQPLLPGHFDAQALLKREKRFRALALGEGIELDQILSIQEALGISSDLFHVEISTSKASPQTPSVFVLSRSAQVVPASQYSSISLPCRKRIWVYIAPEFEGAFLERLHALC